MIGLSPKKTVAEPSYPPRSRLQPGLRFRSLCRGLGALGAAAVLTLAGCGEVVFQVSPNEPVKEQVRRPAGIPVRPTARLAITTTPPTRVEIDGRFVGVTPLSNLSIRPGKHEIVFRDINTGLVLGRRNVEVSRGEYLRIVQRF